MNKDLEKSGKSIEKENKVAAEVEKASDEIEQIATETEADIKNETSALYNIDGADSGDDNDDKKPVKRSTKSKKMRMRGYSLIITVVFLAGIILVNLISGVLVERYPLKLDLTESGTFALSDTTFDLLDNLEVDIKLTMLYDDYQFSSLGTDYAIVNETLKLYDKHSDKITLEYVDIAKNPTFAAKYQDLDLSQGDVIVESEYRTEQVTMWDLFLLEADEYGLNYYIVGSNAEYSVSAAILNTAAPTQPVVTFITGHNELDSQGFELLLDDSGYLVQSGSLTSEGIDPETDVIVVHAPTADYSEDELAMLDAFLENDGDYGKNLVYLPAESGELPNLEAFLEEWGIAITEDIVMETDSSKFFSQTPHFAVLEYVNTEIPGDLVNESIVPVIQLGRNISQAYETRGNRTTSVLLTYSDTSAAIPATDEEIDLDALETSEHPAAIMSQAGFNDGDGYHYSTVVALASYTFTHAAMTGTGSFSNAEYTISLFNDITGREQSLSIPSAELSTGYFEIDAGTATILLVIFVFVIPAVVLLFGVLIWLRRRHL